MHRLSALAAALARDTNCQFYIDISPLLEERWTGIPVVAAQLTQQFLNVLPDNTHAFFEAHEVSRGALVDALARSSGLYLQRDFFNGDANAGPLSLINRPGLAVGVFPSVKRVRGFFPIECSVFHDVSTLITPQFHVAENIDYHMQTVADDLRTNAVSLCVSDATLTDVQAYFGVPAERLVRAYNGVFWPDWFEVQAENDFDAQRMEPYFVVLGTREPRKNISKVLELLVLFTDVLDTHRFVFVGKMGWLEEAQAVPERLRKEIQSGRILFTGFVPEFEKYKLLMGAEATIYPSFFEGFGLPVVESLSVGTPCIASYSSSIPEVGGDVCVYHDPFSVQDLYRAVREIQIDRPKQSAAFRERCRAQARKFTWEGMLHGLLTALTPVIHARMRELDPTFEPGPLEEPTPEPVADPRAEVWHDEPAAEVPLDEVRSLDVGAGGIPVADEADMAAVEAAFARGGTARGRRKARPASTDPETGSSADSRGRTMNGGGPAAMDPPPSRRGADARRAAAAKSVPAAPPRGAKGKTAPPDTGSRKASVAAAAGSGGTKSEPATGPRRSAPPPSAPSGKRPPRGR